MIKQAPIICNILRCTIHRLVYGITNGDGSGYNRKSGVQLNTKSKVGGVISNGEYRSQETKAST